MAHSSTPRSWEREANHALACLTSLQGSSQGCLPIQHVSHQATTWPEHNSSRSFLRASPGCDYNKTQSSLCKEIETIVKRELDNGLKDMRRWLRDFLRPDLVHEVSSLGKMSEIPLESDDVAIHFSHIAGNHDLAKDANLLGNGSLGGIPTWGHAQGAKIEGNDVNTDKLRSAIEENDTSQLRDLLESRGDPNASMVEFVSKNRGKPLKNFPLLAAAIHKQNIDMVRLLVDHGAHFKSEYSFIAGSLQMKWSGSVLFAVPPTHNPTLLKELIALAADPHVVSSNNANLVWQCCYQKQEEMVSYLLKLQVDPNCGAQSQDQEGLTLTPLHVATRACRPKIVQMLLDAKAEITENELGISPLHEAIALWHPGCTYLLVKHGATLVDGRERRISHSGKLLNSASSVDLESPLDLLFRCGSPSVVQFAARGLQEQLDQVRRLRIGDILRFLRSPGKSKTEILQALFRKRELRYRSDALVEVVARSGFINHFNRFSDESFVNVVASCWQHHHFEDAFLGRKQPSKDMQKLFDRLAPKTPRTLATYSLYHAEEVDISIFECLVPDFHEDLRVLSAIARKLDLHFFATRQCQAIIWHSWESIRFLGLLDILLQLILVVLDFLLALDVHYMCSISGAGGKSCFGAGSLNKHPLAISSIPFWLINVYAECINIYSHRKLRMLRKYFDTDNTFLRLLSIILHGAFVVGLVLLPEETTESKNFHLVFASVCFLKWCQFLALMLPFRQIGRPVMPILLSVIELGHLIRFFCFVLLGFVHFWIALNTAPGKETFYDFGFDAALFGMTAEEDDVDDFHSSKRLKVLLIVCTLALPVILMNCTIASMSMTFEWATGQSEALFQKSLATSTFRYATIWRTCCTKSTSSEKPKYLWYSCKFVAD